MFIDKFLSLQVQKSFLPKYNNAAIYLINPFFTSGESIFLFFSFSLNILVFQTEMIVLLMTNPRFTVKWPIRLKSSFQKMWALVRLDITFQRVFNHPLPSALNKADFHFGIVN